MARKESRKKTETLDVRVSHEEKQAFMKAATQRGISASTVIREAMAHFAHAKSGREEKMKRRILWSAMVLAIAALSVGSWEVVRRGEFGSAYADGVTANFQMRIATEVEGERQVFRTMTRILIAPGETGRLTFERVSPDILQAILPDAEMESGYVTVDLSLSDQRESELYMYRIRITIADQDGVVHETPINPTVATRMDSPAAIESRFGTSAEFMINMTPISVES